LSERLNSLNDYEKGAKIFYIIKDI
jgi:hypothetical protein